MVSNTSAINPCSLDFDYIKQSIIDYLSSQSEFSDYDFSGAGLNVLMDILSYNTSQNSFMANMTANEMFLDSSLIRTSAVSHAKSVGYMPRSSRSAMAYLNISIPGVSGSPPFIVMPSGTTFDTSPGYTFSTNTDISFYPSTTDATVYIASEIVIYDGNYSKFSYTVDSSNLGQHFLIPAVDVDITTLRVFVQPSSTSSQIDEYFINDNITTLNNQSLVYFVNETPEGYFEITFGDGTIGASLINGNYITFTYIIAVGKENANLISSFSPVMRISGYTGYTITVLEPSFGGAEKESIDDIKFNAPKIYQSQFRAVNINDYETFITAKYPWIDSINSWGGENNVPPMYGKVFFSIKPKHTTVLSNRLKTIIVNDVISTCNVVTIVPEIIDPDYIYINLVTSVYYNKPKTILSSTQLTNEVNTTITNYFANTTQKFKMNFKYSPMVTQIDSSDPSVDSSLTLVTLHKRIYPIVNLNQTFAVNFNNAINPGSVVSSYYSIQDSSSGVQYPVVLEDDGIGNIRLVKVSTNVVLNAKVGTVNYSTGTVTFTIFPYNLPPDTLDIRVYATPNINNIVSGYNQIILVDDSALNVSVNRQQGVVVNMIPITS